jgi:hypothetical protein
MSEAIRKVYGSRYYRIVRYDFLPDERAARKCIFMWKKTRLQAIKFGLNYNNFTKLD